MNPTALLLATFVISIVGLFAFIWSLRKGLFDQEVNGARAIFSTGEVGHPEEPAADHLQHRRLRVAEPQRALPVLLPVPGSPASARVPAESAA